MINKTSEYALRIVVFLASCEGKTIGREALARQTEVPSDYLVKVIKSLDAAGIVVSSRGPGGGYRLVLDPQQLSVLEVVSAVSFSPRVEKCPLGLKEHVNLCPLHARLDEVAKLTETAFRDTPISDLVPKRGKGDSCVFPAP